jgi:ABC-type lipoprotein export system ATPase subunit
MNAEAATPRPTPTPLVAVHRAARTFGRGTAAVVALHDVTCEILPGQTVAIVGPSGSGKSTLLNLMAGLDLPTRGTVSWPALGDRSALRPGPVAVVFQVPSLIPALDVIENVALPLVLAGRTQVDAETQAARALDQLELAHLAGRLPEDLSGGQAQRVAVARALAGTPRLILADEPTGQLDHVAGALVVDALLHAADTLGAAMVVSTHDPKVAERLAESWSMSDGTFDPQEQMCPA